MAALAVLGLGGRRRPFPRAPRRCGLLLLGAIAATLLCEALQPVLFVGPGLPGLGLRVPPSSAPELELDPPGRLGETTALRGLTREEDPSATGWGRSGLGLAALGAAAFMSAVRQLRNPACRAAGDATNTAEAAAAEARAAAEQGAPSLAAGAPGAGPSGPGPGDEGKAAEYRKAKEGRKIDIKKIEGKKPLGFDSKKPEVKKTEGKHHDKPIWQVPGGGMRGAQPEVDEESLASKEAAVQNLAQQQDFKGAAALRDELSRSQVEDEASVLQAHSALYKAFSARDIRKMEAMLHRAPYVECIHPRERLHGHVEVSAAWDRLFQRAVKQKKNFTITPEDVRVSLRGTTAVVTCVEQTVAKDTRRVSRGMCATNIFRKVGPEWLLVHRHVSRDLGSAQDDQARLPLPIRLRGMRLMWQRNMGGRSFHDAEDAYGDVDGSVFEAEEIDEEDEDFDEEDFMEVAEEVEQAENLQKFEKFARQRDFNHHGFSRKGGMADTDDDTGSSADEMDIGSDSGSTFDDEAAQEAREVSAQSIKALRHLVQNKLLDEKAKTLLMYEMVRTPGESMPEKAYDMLLFDVESEAGDAHKQAAWNEFAALMVEEARRLEENRAMELAVLRRPRSSSPSRDPDKTKRRPRGF